MHSVKIEDMRKYILNGDVLNVCLRVNGVREVINDAVSEVSLTLLQLAVWYNRPEIVEVLTRNGANVDLAPDTELTPLALAIGAQNLEMVKTLVKLGADLHIKAIGTLTALEYAFQVNDPEIVQVLLEHGAYTSSTKSSFEKAALSYNDESRETNYSIIRNIITSYENKSHAIL